MMKLLRLAWNGISEWSLPAKFVIAAILSAVGGAGFVSILSEYATYSYARSYGFRVPVESTPYLRAFATTTSFVLFMLGGLVAATLITIVRWTLSYEAKSSSAMFHEPEGSPIFSLKKVVLATFFGGTMAALWFFIFPIFCEWTGKCPRYVPGVRAISIQFGLIAALSVFTMGNRKLYTWMTAPVSTLILFFTVIVVIFTPTDYAYLLRNSGFGGGMQIELKFKESAREKNRSAFLLLRTADVYVLYDPVGEKIEEIDASLVQAVLYSAGGLEHLPSRLPTMLTK